MTLGVRHDEPGAAGRGGRTRTLRLAGWALVALLGTVAVLRLVAWDDLEPLIILNALSLYVYLPAWPVAVAAGLSRQYLLSAGALAVVAAQLAFVLPEFTAATPPPRWTATAPTIRLLDANVNDSNRSMAGYIAQIKSDRPQLLTLEEANPADAEQLLRSGALSALSYRYEVGRWDPWAFVVASAYPLVGTRTVAMFGRPLIVETTLEAPGGPISLWVVHTVAPRPSSWQQLQGQLTRITSLVSRRRTDHLLVVGDFNETWNNRAFRALLATGLADGAAVRGDALGMTWSQEVPPIPPFVRIDHVLSGSGVAVLSIHPAVGVGSDHRDDLATVALRPQ